VISKARCNLCGMDVAIGFLDPPRDKAAAAVREVELRLALQELAVLHRNVHGHDLVLMPFERLDREPHLGEGVTIRDGRRGW